MNAFFAEFGRAVARQWQERNFSQEAFPDLALALLEENPPSRHVDLAALVRDFLLDDTQPFQTASGFGQPELVVYDDGRFYIQLLFWLDGTTQIHQHGFDGAFHVLAGSSLHTEYAFRRAQRVTAGFRVGDLVAQGTELLETGASRPIRSGSDHIHALFHLETPSVTVVVRTHTAPESGPQFTYLPPRVALDPFQSDPLTQRRLQLLDVLAATEDDALGELLIAMIDQLDFERGFFVLQNSLAVLRAAGWWDEAWQTFRRKHGRLAAGIAETLDEIVWRDRLVALRGRVDDPDHRFFLALLLNVSQPEKILHFVGRRYPGRPAATVLRWAEELTESSGDGTWILDAEFPHALGVPEDEQPVVFLAVLHFLVAGGKPPVPPRTLRAIREAFAASSLRAFSAPRGKKR
jgi:hypothetical protein